MEWHLVDGYTTAMEGIFFEGPDGAQYNTTRHNLLRVPMNGAFETLTLYISTYCPFVLLEFGRSVGDIISFCSNEGLRDSPFIEISYTHLRAKRLLDRDGEYRMTADTYTDLETENTVRKALALMSQKFAAVAVFRKDFRFSCLAFCVGEESTAENRSVVIKFPPAFRMVHGDPIRLVPVESKLNFGITMKMLRSPLWFLGSHGSIGRRFWPQVQNTVEVPVGDGRPVIKMTWGPPGTGKSKSLIDRILEIIRGYRRIRRDEKWLEASPEDTDTDTTSEDTESSSERGFVVCAPTNAAVDHLMEVIVSHNMNLSENDRIPIVRIGVKGKMKESLRCYHIDEQLHVMSNRHIGYKTAEPAYQRTLRAEMKENIITLSVIFATLRAAVNELVVGGHGRALYVDEAAMATELELIGAASNFNVSEICLYGDPRQLRAVVDSTAAKENGATTSLMERIWDNVPISCFATLLTQRRMVQELWRWPREQFYNDVDVASGQIGRSIRLGMLYRDDAGSGVQLGDLPAMTIFNVVGEEKRDGSSFFNEQEVIAVVAVVQRLLCLGVVRQSSIGIITPYKAQEKKIRIALLSSTGLSSDEVTVSTVDGFQGIDREIIIFSAVRSSRGTENKAVGFIDDSNRVNVTMTRARLYCFWIGNTEFIFRNTVNWRSMIRAWQDNIHGIDLVSSITDGER